MWNRIETADRPLLAHLSHLAFSTGSACTSGALEPSQVLTAIGLSRADAYATVRVGLGRFTTIDEVQVAARDIVGAAERLHTLTNTGAI